MNATRKPLRTLKSHKAGDLYMFHNAMQVANADPNIGVRPLSWAKSDDARKRWSFIFLFSGEIRRCICLPNKEQYNANPELTYDDIADVWEQIEVP